jgi:hypothetical protein
VALDRLHQRALHQPTRCRRVDCRVLLVQLPIHRPGRHGPQQWPRRLPRKRLARVRLAVTLSPSRCMAVSCLSERASERASVRACVRASLSLPPSLSLSLAFSRSLPLCLSVCMFLKSVLSMTHDDIGGRGSHVKLWNSYMNKQCVKSNKGHYWFTPPKSHTKPSGPTTRQHSCVCALFLPRPSLSLSLASTYACTRVRVQPPPPPNTHTREANTHAYTRIQGVHAGKLLVPVCGDSSVHCRGFYSQKSSI